MDKKRALLNVGVSITFKMLVLVANILARRFLIQYLGNSVNGLNSLYVSIIDVLSVAELGIGSAITFSMYRPIVEGDRAKVAALYKLYRKLYLIVGGIILAVGCAVMPLLPFLAKGHEAADVNLYLTFGLMLISVVMSYAYSAKTSLINAHKNDYITTTINSAGTLLMHGLQIAVTIWLKSFEAYLACRIITTSLQWVVTAIIVKVKYGGLTKLKAELDAETKTEVTKNIRAMFMHKIGGVLVNSADSLIISAFISSIVLGYYTNYTVIVSAMIGFISMTFTPLTSVLGHMCVEEDSATAQRYFRFFHTVNFILGTVFFLGYYAVIDNVVSILFGPDLELNKAISFVITMNYFISFMRQATLVFKDATGTFYYDRWKPLCEGACNVVLSIIFVLVFPEDFKVVGVIVATIITNILICHIVEPYVLYKHAFKASPKRYYIRNYICIAAFAAVLVTTHFCMVDIDSNWLQFLANGFIAVGIAVVPCLVAILLNKDFIHYFRHFKERRKAKLDTEAPAESETPEVSEEVTVEEVNVIEEGGEQTE